MWDGTTWTVDSIPGHKAWAQDQLVGVSCTAADACTAVGSFYKDIADPKTLAEAWDGTSWSIVKTPNSPAPPSVKNGGFPYSSAPNSVSCWAAAGCTSVGESTVVYTHQALAESAGA